MSAGPRSRLRSRESFLQRCLFVACIVASSFLMWPTWNEASYHAQHGDLLGGQERIFLMIVMARPIILHGITLSFLAATVITAYLWRKIPAVRIRVLGWGVLFIAGGVKWPALSQFGTNPTLFRDVVNLVLLISSMLIAVTSLMWPANSARDVNIGRDSS